MDNPISVIIERARGKREKKSEKYEFLFFADILEKTKLADGTVESRRCKSVRFCNINGKFVVEFPQEPVTRELKELNISDEWKTKSGLPANARIIAEVPVLYKEGHRNAGEQMYADVGPQHANPRSRELFTAACRTAAVAWIAEQKRIEAENAAINADSAPTSTEIPAQVETSAHVVDEKELAQV